MEINKKELQSIITQAVESAIAALEKRHFIVDEKPKEKSAYAKTESLLYNYRGFQRVVEDRMKEIEDDVLKITEAAGGGESTDADDTSELNDVVEKMVK